MGRLRKLPEGIVKHIIMGVPTTAIMNKLMTTTSALYGYDATADSELPVENFKKSINLISKFSTIIAYTYLRDFLNTDKFVEAPENLFNC